MTRQLRIVLAAVLAIASGVLTYLLLHQPGGRQVAVISAAEEIEPCKPLMARHLKTIKLDAAAADVLKAQTRREALIGKTAYRPVRKGEVFIDGDPTIGKGPSQDTQPPAGKRFVTLRSLQLQTKPCAFLDLYTRLKQGDRVGANLPVVDHPVQVVSVSAGIVVVVDEAEVQKILTAETDGALYAVVAPPVKEVSS